MFGEGKTFPVPTQILPWSPAGGEENVHDLYKMYKEAGEPGRRSKCVRTSGDLGKKE